MLFYEKFGLDGHGRSLHGMLPCLTDGIRRIQSSVARAGLYVSGAGWADRSPWVPQRDAGAAVGGGGTAAGGGLPPAPWAREAVPVSGRSCST